MGSSKQVAVKYEAHSSRSVDVQFTSDIDPNTTNLLLQKILEDGKN